MHHLSREELLKGRARQNAKNGILQTGRANTPCNLDHLLKGYEVFRRIDLLEHPLEAWVIAVQPKLCQSLDKLALWDLQRMTIV